MLSLRAELLGHFLFPITKIASDDNFLSRFSVNLSKYMYTLLIPFSRRGEVVQGRTVSNCFMIFEKF